MLPIFFSLASFIEVMSKYECDNVSLVVDAHPVSVYWTQVNFARYICFYC